MIKTESMSLLQEARVAFDKLGRIPFELTKKLRERGLFAPAFEMSWAAERN
jgi:hypothetical protein